MIFDSALMVKSETSKVASKPPVIKAPGALLLMVRILIFILVI
jgi:hypothetical protein